MKMSVLILGYGEMGHAMEYLLADKHDIRIWTRSGTVQLEEEASQADVILFCLPVNAHREICQRIVPVLSNKNLCLSIAKGLDEAGMTAAQVFAQYFPRPCRYGVIYGPMISEEIIKGCYSFAEVALAETGDFPAIRRLFLELKLFCEQTEDMHGISWSVILKNVYAILFGITDELKLGANVRGHLIVHSLAELSGICKILGGGAAAPYSYAGLGDLLTTATSENSHHHELGRELARGNFANISGEGIHTLQMIEKHQIFDSTSFPLFNLVREIVNEPEELNQLLDLYFRKLLNR